MKKKIILGAVLCALTILPFTSNVFAEEEAKNTEEKKEAGTGPSPYTECGIGASLFPNTHWAAVTSNVIWDLGLTALTSATASPDTCNGKKATAAAFIYNTYDNLVEETAAGDGDHIVTLFNILDVDENAHNKIVSHIRKGMGEQLTSSTYDQKDQVEKSSQYYNLMIEALEKYTA